MNHPSYGTPNSYHNLFDADLALGSVLELHHGPKICIYHRTSRFHEEIGRWYRAKPEKIRLQNGDFFVCRSSRVAPTYPYFFTFPISFKRQSTVK